MKLAKGKQNQIIYGTSAVVALVLTVILIFYWQ